MPSFQYIRDIREAQEWIVEHLRPVSELAPMTDSSGTKAAYQNVLRLQGDVSAFHRNTIGPLSARLQNRSVIEEQGNAGFVPPEERTRAIVGDDLRKMTDKYPGGNEHHDYKNMQTNLNHEMVRLMLQLVIHFLHYYSVICSISVKQQFLPGCRSYNLRFPTDL